MPRPIIKQTHTEEQVDPIVAAARYRALRHIWDLRGPATASVAFAYIMSRRDGTAEENPEE
jgi:hypothetical protein